MDKYKKISGKLISSLKSKGVHLEPAATQVIIFAIAEAYSLGEEEGILIGRKKSIEEFDRIKRQMFIDLELDEHLFNEKVNNYKYNNY